MPSKLTTILDAIPSDDYTVGGEGWNQLIKILKNVNVESEEDLTINTKVKWQSGKLTLLDSGFPSSHEITIDVEDILSGDPRHLVVRAFNETTEYLVFEKEAQVLHKKTFGDNAVADSEAKFGKTPNFQGFGIDRVGTIKIEDIGDRNVSFIEVSNTNPNTYFEVLSGYNTANHAGISGGTDIKLRFGFGSEIDNYEFWSQADGTNAKLFSISETLIDIPATTIDFHNSTINNISLAKSQIPASVAYEDEANIFTALQTIQANIVPSLELYKTSNSGNIGLHFYGQSSTGLKRRYSALDTAIVTNTNGDEDAYITLGVVKDGIFGTKWLFNHNGNFFFRTGVSGPYAILSPSAIADTDKVITIPNITGNMLTDNSIATLLSKTILDSDTAGQLNQIGVHMPYTFTIYQNASFYIVRNNWTGVLQTFAKTDFAVALEWAINNVANVNAGPGSSVTGGGIFIQRGIYTATTTVNVDAAVALRHGISIEGEGNGTHIFFDPPSGTPITNGFHVVMQGFRLRSMRIRANQYVTNIIYHTGPGLGVRRSDHYKYEYLMVEGPNGDAGHGGNPVNIAGQVGIKTDGTNPASYFGMILGCEFIALETAIHFFSSHSTSCRTIGNVIWSCEYGIVHEGAGQNIIDGLWVQGNTMAGTTGIWIKGAGKNTVIDNVIAEMKRENPPGTEVACRAVLIDTGVQEMYIGQVNNVFEGIHSLSKTVEDNSGNTTNTHESHLNVKEKNFIRFQYSDNSIRFNTSRIVLFGNAQIFINDLDGSHNYLIKGGGISGAAGAKTVQFPDLDDTIVSPRFVFHNTTQTLERKTLLDSGIGNQIGVHVPYTFTIYQTASNYIVRNNHTGALQSFANTDFAPVLEWAMDNIVNVGLGTQSSLYAGGIFIQRGIYTAKTTINPDIDTTTRHGILITGEGWATEIYLNPDVAQTDGFLVDMASLWIRDLKVKANANVTNLFHLIGHGQFQRRNDYIVLDHVMFEGPNGNDGWATLPHIPNQVAILFDGSGGLPGIANFFTTITNCKINSFEKGIHFKGQYTTSCFCKDNVLKWCETGVEISDGAGQIQIDGLWIQGDTFTGTTGVKVSSTAGGFVYIDHITAELHRENAGSPVASQAVLIESGIGNCHVGPQISNAYSGVDPLWKIIVNNSTNINYVPSQWNVEGKNFITITPSSDLISINANRKVQLKTGSLLLSDTGNDHNWIFKAGGNLAGSVNVVFPLLASGAAHPDYTVVFEDGVAQTLTGKTFNGIKFTHPAAKTSAYTVTDTDYYVPCDATGGNFAVTLPTAVGRAGQTYFIRKTQSTNNVTVTPNGAETINGKSTIVLQFENQILQIWSDGANWKAGNQHLFRNRETDNIFQFLVPINIFPNAGLYINDSNGSANYIIRGGDIAAGQGSKFMNIPDVSADDFFVLRDIAQELKLKTFDGLTMKDATNIILNTTTGSKIGTAATQKLGFWNATPVAQPTAVADATNGTDVITQLNALLSRLRTIGIIAAA